MPLTADAINAQMIGAHKGISGGTSFEHDDMGIYLLVLGIDQAPNNQFKNDKSRSSYNSQICCNKSQNNQ